MSALHHWGSGRPPPASHFSFPPGSFTPQPPSQEVLIPLQCLVQRLCCLLLPCHPACGFQLGLFILWLGQGWIWCTGLRSSCCCWCLRVLRVQRCERLAVVAVAVSTNLIASHEDLETRSRQQILFKILFLILNLSFYNPENSERGRNLHIKYCLHLFRCKVVATSAAAAVYIDRAGKNYCIAAKFGHSSAYT